MSSGWHHRVLRTADGEHSIVEAYHTDGVYDGYTEPFVVGDELASLRQTLERMMAALDHPALTPQDFKRDA